MGLARLLPERSYNPGSEPVFYGLPGGFGLTASAYTGQDGLEAALKNAASWACIRVLMDAIARTPITAVRELRGARTPIDPQPRILARPSGLVATDVWKGQLAYSILTDGNAFGRVVETGQYALPTQIEILDPTTVTDRKLVDGVPHVQVAHRTPEPLWPHGTLWHLPGDMVLPGTVFAISPITYATKVIGTSLAAEDFSFRFFDDGGHPPVALVSDEDLDGDKARAIKRNYLAATRGTREPLVFGSGLKLQELKLDPSETQFIDLMRFCVEQACRFWGVPPSMVFSSIGGQHMTYSNVTQADLHFLKHALEGKFVRLETEFGDLLPGNSFTSPSVPNTIALCDRNAVLKADPKTRFDTHAVALLNRFKTVNEVRAEEGDAPFDGAEFDVPGVPPFAPTPDPNGVDAPTSTTQPTKGAGAAVPGSET